jgi:hypothetical protein
MIRGDTGSLIHGWGIWGVWGIWGIGTPSGGHQVDSTQFLLLNFINVFFIQNRSWKIQYFSNYVHVHSHLKGQFELFHRKQGPHCVVPSQLNVMMRATSVIYQELYRNNIS